MQQNVCYKKEINLKSRSVHLQTHNRARTHTHTHTWLRQYLRLHSHKDSICQKKKALGHFDNQPRVDLGGRESRLRTLDLSDVDCGFCRVSVIKNDGQFRQSPFATSWICPGKVCTSRIPSTFNRSCFFGGTVKLASVVKRMSILAYI